MPLASRFARARLRQEESSGFIRSGSATGSKNPRLFGSYFATVISAQIIRLKVTSPEDFEPPVSDERADALSQTMEDDWVLSINRPESESGPLRVVHLSRDSRPP